MDSVTVETGSRLHFGPLAWRSTGRNFGGIGMMIDAPKTVVSATRAEEFSYRGPSSLEKAVSTVLRSVERQSSLRATIDVRNAADRHRGFGSGTQLACAVATALAGLDGDASNFDLATWSGRGKRSAIGLHGFQQGGFLVDAGRRDNSVGTIVSRLPFPEQWPVFVDTGSGDGLAGQPEAEAFAALAPMPEEMTARLCDLTLRAMMPALIDCDFETFGPALTEYGRIAGKFFQAAQGGEFVDPTWTDDIESLSNELPVAIAQSSWGPAVAVIVQDENAASAVKARLPHRNLKRVTARNSAASVTVKEQAAAAYSSASDA